MAETSPEAPIESIILMVDCTVGVGLILLDRRDSHVAAVDVSVLEAKRMSGGVGGRGESLVAITGFQGGELLANFMFRAGLILGPTGFS